jgi:acetyl-CoA carboxylase carboxyl transferase subunit alpha
MLRSGVIDRISPSPRAAPIATPRHDRPHRRAIAQAFTELRNFDADGIRRQRRQKFRISAASSAEAVSSWPGASRRSTP